MKSQQFDFCSRVSKQLNYYIVFGMSHMICNISIQYKSGNQRPTLRVFPVDTSDLLGRNDQCGLQHSYKRVLPDSC